MYRIFLFCFWVSSVIANAQADFTQFVSETGGVVLAHSPKSTKKFVGSPSICILPNGEYVASHDLFGLWDDKKLGPVTKIYLSSDKGKTWKHTADLTNQYWSTLFVLNKKLYIIGTNNNGGSVTIRRSDDGGRNQKKVNTGFCKHIDRFFVKNMFYNIFSVCSTLFILWVMKFKILLSAES